MALRPLPHGQSSPDALVEQTTTMVLLLKNTAPGRSHRHIMVKPPMVSHPVSTSVRESSRDPTPTVSPVLSLNACRWSHRCVGFWRTRVHYVERYYLEDHPEDVKGVKLVGG